MTKRARRNHTSAFKAKVAFAAIKGEMRIPTKPATNSNRKPATHSDLKPAGIPIDAGHPTFASADRGDDVAPRRIGQASADFGPAKAAKDGRVVKSGLGGGG